MSCHPPLASNLLGFVPGDLGGVHADRLVNNVKECPPSLPALL